MTEKNRVLPPNFKLRNIFTKGKQAKVTSNIVNVSKQFNKLEFPKGFKNIHSYLYKKLKIIPYTEGIKEIERKRRWKLTADELLKIGTIVDTKYCNDIVNLFLAIAKSLGFKARLAKVFDKYENVHSLAIVDILKTDNRYLINIGSKDKYWIKPLSKDLKLKFGKKLPDGWVVWKIGLDQWSIGLNDSSQERATIVADAKKFFDKN